MAKTTFDEKSVRHNLKNLKKSELIDRVVEFEKENTDLFISITELRENGPDTSKAKIVDLEEENESLHLVLKEMRAKHKTLNQKQLSASTHSSQARITIDRQKLHIDILMKTVEYLLINNGDES